MYVKAKELKALSDAIDLVENKQHVVETEDLKEYFNNLEAELQKLSRKMYKQFNRQTMNKPNLF